MMSEKEELYNKTWFTAASWIGKSENHILSAECLNSRYLFLFKEFEKSLLNNNINEQVALLETIPFLCGIAIENAIKALIIYRNPNIKSQKELLQLKQWKSNHDIFTMLEHEKVIIDKSFIKRMQKALVWSGKYPLPYTKQYNQDKNYNLHEYSTKDVNTTKDIISQIKQLIQTQ